MKTLFNTVSENFEAKNESTVVNECVVAARRLAIDDNGETNDTGDKSYVLIKHRDRAYNVNCSIVHTVVNGIEIAYLRDDDTFWSEGMNDKGVCIINSSLSLADETIGKAGKGDKDKSDKAKTANVATKFSADGEKIVKALSMSTIDDAIHFAKTWKNGIHGNTLIATDDELYTISSTSRHPAVISKLDGLDTVVFTNHSDIHKDAGYTEGPSFKSSLLRKSKSEDILAAANTPSEMLVNLRKQPFRAGSQNNPLRTTDTLNTCSQMILDPKNLHLHLVVFKKYTENFKGIVDQLPSGYEPKIKITFEEI